MFRKLLCNKAPILALLLVTMVPNVSRAETLTGQPIYARNNTSRPIWVAAKYMSPGSNSFVTDGFWQIAPGQCVRILYNSNRYIYFYARDDNGTVWTGSDTSGFVHGERVNMAQQDTGLCFEPWTMSFNP
jgi:uncharacterized membrane protein